jgi:uncharacterized protein YbaR (Trm112 family)
MPLSKELLDVLACPQCKGPLEYKEKADQLVCGTCRLIYAIQDGIPVMLVDQATPLAV